MTASKAAAAASYISALPDWPRLYCVTPRSRYVASSRSNLGKCLHHDFEALPGQVELVGLEIADAQVVERPIAARIGLVGVDELRPLFGGRFVGAAVLQRHGRIVLLRGRPGLLWPRAGAGRARNQQSQGRTTPQTARTIVRIADTMWREFVSISFENGLRPGSAVNYSTIAAKYPASPRPKKVVPQETLAANAAAAGGWILPSHARASMVMFYECTELMRQLRCTRKSGRPFNVPPQPRCRKPMIPWQWIGFAVLVAVLLGLDLLVFHRHDRAPSLRESAGWTCSGAAWPPRSTPSSGGSTAREAGVAFFTGYVIEWSLSMDNVFVFAVIFRFFQVPMQYQYRVLVLGHSGGDRAAAGVRAGRHAADPPLRLGAAAVRPAPGLHGREAGPARRRRSAAGEELRAPARPAAVPRDRGRPPPARPRLLRPRERPALHHAAVPGAAGDREHRRAVRRRQRAGHLRHHRRPVHRLHLEHLRHPGPAGVVLPAGRRDRAVPVPALRPGAVLAFVGAEHDRRLLGSQRQGIAPACPPGLKLVVVAVLLGISIVASMARKGRGKGRIRAD